MLELVAAYLLGAVPLLVALRFVNIRRMYAWAARDASVQGQVRANEAFAETWTQLRQAHDEELAGQEETPEWADRILLTHDWHIGGKADPHDMGVLVRYECSCGAVTHAKEGAL